MKKLQALILVALLGASITFPGLTAAGEENSDQPNILFIISDDLGARLGCYGEIAVKSPNLDQLASRGTLFERCYTQCPSCGPSRMSMLSGLYLHESGLAKQMSRLTQSKIPAVSLPHLFRKNGYTTARVGKVFHMRIPGDIGTAGNDEPEAWDVAVNNTGWDAQAENLRKVNRHGDRKDFGVSVTYLDPDITNEQMADGVGTNEAIRIMKEHHPKETGKPLMLFMGYFRTHPPMIAPRSNWDAIDANEIQLPKVPENDRKGFPEGALPLRGPGHNDLPSDVGREYSHAYYASIHFIDLEIAKLLEGLKANGLDQNTIVIVTGDQGFHLGEHNYWHKTSAFDPSSHVPLIILDPRSPKKGQRAAGLCGLIDLYPTLCDLAEIRPEHPLSGKSLVPRLHDASLPGKEWELSQFQNGISLRTDRYRYTELNDGVMMHDLQQDPSESQNLAGKPEFAEQEKLLRETLVQNAPAVADDAVKEKKTVKKRAGQDAAISVQLIKMLQPVGLTEEQTKKIKELGGVTVAKMSEIREAAGLTPKLLKEYAKAQKLMKTSGKKGKELKEAIHAEAGLSEEQATAMKSIKDARFGFQNDAMALLTDEQKEKLPAKMKRDTKVEKKKKDAA